MTTEEMLDDCIETLRVSNCPFNDWEKEFILEMNELTSWSPKQRETIEKIWDKI